MFGFDRMTAEWEDISAPASSSVEVTASQVTHGPLIPPQQLLLLCSPDQWEDFVQEWAHYCLKKIYAHEQRFTRAGDRGVDVAGFADALKLQGVWDNCQRKHFAYLKYGKVRFLLLGYWLNANFPVSETRKG